MQYLDAISEATEWFWFISKANHSTSNPSLCLNHQCRRSRSWTVLWRPPRPSSTNTKVTTGDWNSSRNSRDTWSNRQVWPWSTKWNRVKSNRVLSREHTGHNKHPLPATQETTLHIDITKLSISKSDWLYSLHLKIEKLYTVSKNKTWSWLAQIMRSLLQNSSLNWRK